MRRSVLLALVLGGTAAAADEGAAAWVKARVADQRAALERRAAAAAPLPDGGLFREADEGRRAAIPGFAPPTSLAPLVRAVRPGVVNIATVDAQGSRSMGSGFLISADGFCVTNNHVVERAQAIRVRLADGRVFDADVVGRDPSTDLALLKVRGEGSAGLPTVVLGDSDRLEVGDWIVAIGNPFGLDTSVTHGIISARERVIGVGPFDDFIQTNALINPGNSGGPLFDMRGEVVGVTTAMVSQGQGIGFAAPINLVKDLLPNLRSNGRLARGWLGVNIHDRVDAQGTRAAVVLDVFKASPAERAGLKPGDRVVAVGGRQVESYTQLLRRVALLAPGSKVKLQVLREGKAEDLEAVLAERPSGEVLQVLAGTGRVSALGVVLKDLTAAAARQLGVDAGVLVALVLPGGPAAAAGLEAGDVVLEVNRRRVADVAQVRAVLAAGDRDEPVLLRVQRGDAAQLLLLRPGG